MQAWEYSFGVKKVEKIPLEGRAVRFVRDMGVDGAIGKASQEWRYSDKAAVVKRELLAGTGEHDISNKFGISMSYIKNIALDGGFRERKKNRPCKRVIMRDMVKGEVIVFDSSRDAAMEIGVANVTISRACRMGKGTSVLKRYEFTYEENR